MTMRHCIAALSLAVLAVPVAAQEAAPGAAAAPTAAADQAQMESLRKAIASDKRKIVESNLSLTEREAAAFWPVYDRYQGELATINKRIVGDVDMYASAYDSQNVTDTQAATLGNELLLVEEAELKSKRQMYRDVSAVLPPKKAARYLQIETKLRALVRYSLAEEIPLIP